MSLLELDFPPESKRMVLYPLIYLYILLPHTFREKDKMPSQPSLSQANQAQLSQPVLV